MTEISWDPLSKSSDIDAEILASSIKRQLKNILKSYVGMYDPFSELIQNAMDAVDRRQQELSEAGYQKKLWLTIDLSENSFSILDNGIGFNEAELKSFLAPNISYKEDGPTRGNKGVGATYIGYGFDYLQFGTKREHYQYSGELNGGREWVEDYKGIKTRPVVESCKIIDDGYSSIDRGSFFKIKFGGTETRPKDLSWYAAKTPDQWLYLLLIKTPLGTIEFTETNNDTIKFDLSVIDKDGSRKEIHDQDAKYIFPNNKINASTNMYSVIQYQENALKNGKDPSILPTKFHKCNGLYSFFTKDQLLEMRLSDSEIEVIEQYNVEAYGYFAFSTSVWDQLNDTHAKLRKGYRVLKGGLQLANNRMTQGELISIPLTSNIGYQNQCHIVVHFNNADPDLGRKGFQPELKDAGEKIAVNIVNKLKAWKRLLKVDSGAKPNIAGEIELHDWIRQQESYETTNPLLLTNPNFFAPINEISITSEPQSEQDVIVLFNQLIAGGVIRGINLLATSQIKQYDGVFKFVGKQPIENHIFDKDTNPLGVAEFHFNGVFSTAPKILEYKYNMDALIHEFENETKHEKDIHLAVTWEMGEEWKRNYEATSLLDLDNLHLRDFHGITHILKSSTTEFYVIALKELMAYLNNVDEAQEYHKSNYDLNMF